MAVNDFSVDFTPLAQLANTYRQGRERDATQQWLQQQGLPGNLTLASLALANQRDQRDFALRKDEITRNQSNADRSFGLQERQFNAGIEGARMQPGFEKDPLTGGVRPVKGGPADPEYIHATTEAKDKGRQLNPGDIGKLSEEGGKFSNINEFVNTFKDDFGGYRANIVGGLAMQAGRSFPELTSKNTADAAKWWQGYDRYRNVVRNELFGSALTAPERQAFDAADITPGMAADVIKENLATQQKVLRGAMQRRAGALVSEGFRPESIARSFGVKLEDLGVAPKPKSGTSAKPPVQGARQAEDGNFYVPDPARPGKYLKVIP